MALRWEYEVGPLKMNFRVLMEPKGFLRIIIAVSGRLESIKSGRLLVLSSLDLGRQCACVVVEH